MTITPYIELYRPKTFDEVVGDTSRFIEILKTPVNMPNMLLWGPQGTGKTTIAKIILDNLKPIDILRINGSDNTGIDTIRDKVFNFITAMSSIPGKPKIVWIEEFDFMSVNAYAALRSMMEQYMGNARFICTCNYLTKIPEPIRSRFSLFEFKKSTDYQEIEARLLQICMQEEITVDGENTLIDLITKHKADIRAIINDLQILSSNADKKITAIDVGNTKSLSTEIFELLKKGEWSKIRYEIPKHNPDYNKLLVELADTIFESEYSTSQKADITSIISQGMFEMAFVFDQDICFSAICARIIKKLINNV